MDLFDHAPVPPETRYFAVNMSDPFAVRPVTMNDAVAACRLLPPRINAFPSEAALVSVPVIAKPMKSEPPPVVFAVPAETDTSTLPDAGIVTVTAGPTVARST